MASVQIKDTEYGWAAQPSPDTTVGQLATTCKKFDLETMVIRGKVYMIKYSSTECPNQEQLEKSLNQ